MSARSKVPWRRPSPLTGLLVTLLAVPAVLLADALGKRVARRRRNATSA